MKNKVILLISLLMLLIGSTMVFATEQPSNEDLVTVTEEASVEAEVTNEEVVYIQEGVTMQGDEVYVNVDELSDEFIEEVTSDEGVELYLDTLYDQPVSSTNGTMTIYLRATESGTKTLNYYYKNTGQYPTTVSIEHDTAFGWKEEGDPYVVQPGLSDFDTINTNANESYRIQLVNKNAGTYPISGQLKVQPY